MTEEHNALVKAIVAADMEANPGISDWDGVRRAFQSVPDLRVYTHRQLKHAFEHIHHGGGRFARVSRRNHFFFLLSVAHFYIFFLYRDHIREAQPV